MEKRGRKPIEIDEGLFERLCGIQCTEEEICAAMGITDKTLAKWCQDRFGKKFSEVFREKRMNGRASLRRHQWNLAKKSPAMAIWLGKQYLGQKETIETTSSGVADDNFLQALSATAKDDWNEGGDV